MSFTDLAGNAILLHQLRHRSGCSLPSTGWHNRIRTEKLADYWKEQQIICILSLIIITMLLGRPYRPPFSWRAWPSTRAGSPPAGTAASLASSTRKVENSNDFWLKFTFEVKFPKVYLDCQVTGKFYRSGKVQVDPRQKWSAVSRELWRSLPSSSG